MEFHQRYRFNPKTDLLGKGGFSRVYKATDTLLDRTVALKFFTGNLTDKYQVLNEIKKVIRFEHPNLCKYYDVAVLSITNVVGETEEIEVGIMEYIDAGDFKAYARNNPEHVDKLLIGVLKGLAFLHRRGIAHRDLKPQNILVKIDDEEPVSKITDFGISKVIAADDPNTSALLGTIEYMAPEQFNPKKYGINGRITTNLDLWSYGLLVYEIVCHQSFFGSRSGGISAGQVMTNILSDASLDKIDTVPAKYQEIVKRCLVKNAADRVQNATDLLPLLDIYEAHPQPSSYKMSVEVPQIVKSGVPVKEDLPESIATQLINLETTQVNDLNNEDAGDATQVIDFLPDFSGDETQIIERPTFETSEITQVIEPLPEPEEEKTEIIEIRETPPVLPDYKNYKEIDRNNKGLTNSRPIAKIAILSSLAALLIFFFIAYSFLSERTVNSDPEPVDTVAAAPIDPPIEDWKPELVPVRGGKFTMGDFTANDISSAADAHEVIVGDFQVGKYEVTVAQFKKFVDETGYVSSATRKGFSSIFAEGKWKDRNGIDWRYDARGKLISSNMNIIPVVHVSWLDANAYCEWLSRKTHEPFRLLTEAEWEFAAKGGNSSKQYTYSGSDSIGQVAWYQKNSDSAIHTIGTKKSNELSIYDMSGNALEWCNDWYDKGYYSKALAKTPEGQTHP